MKTYISGIILILSLQVYSQGVVSTLADGAGAYGYFGGGPSVSKAVLIGSDFIQSTQEDPIGLFQNVLGINRDGGQVEFGSQAFYSAISLPPPMVRIANPNNNSIDLGYGGDARISTEESFVLYLNYGNQAAGGESFQIRDGTSSFANTAFIVYENGNGTFKGTVTATAHLNTSDVRYKKNITPLSNTMTNLSLINGVRFYWDQEEWPNHSFNNESQIGFIAQEVEAVYPALVHTDEEGYKSVAYDKMTAVLVEAVKELKTENEVLKKLLLSMEARISRLE